MPISWQTGVQGHFISGWWQTTEKWSIWILISLADRVKRWWWKWLEQRRASLDVKKLGKRRKWVSKIPSLCQHITMFACQHITMFYSICQPYYNVCFNMSAYYSVLLNLPTHYNVCFNMLAYYVLFNMSAYYNVCFNMSIHYNVCFNMSAHNNVLFNLSTHYNVCFHLSAYYNV